MYLGGAAYRNRSAYSYHYYCHDYVQNMPEHPILQKVVCDQGIAPEIYKSVQRDLNRIGGAAMQTEGMQCNSNSSECVDNRNALDQRLFSWIDWNFEIDDGTPGREQQATRWARTYARAVAGAPSNMSFDPQTKEFHFCFRMETAIRAPTEIFASTKYNYQHGLAVSTSTNNVNATIKGDLVYVVPASNATDGDVACVHIEANVEAHEITSRRMKSVAKAQKTEDEEATAKAQAANPFHAYEYGGGNLSWVRGANYVPSSSHNDLATWVDYDEALVAQELRWAGASGFNAVRVFLHHLAHEVNAPQLLARVEHLLSSAAAAKIQVMFVLFDSCGRVNIANSSWILDGTYRNRTWIANPAPAIVDAGRNSSSWPQLERYVHDIVSVHRADSRVIGWDIHNEPSISQDPALLPFIQHWIGIVNGLIDHRIQFTCVGGAQSAPHTEPALSNLTVLTYHDYSGTTLSKDVAQAQAIGRKLRKPTLITECMARVPTSDGYDSGDSLRAVLRGTNGCDAGAAATGFFIWELMFGVDQFTYDWHRPYQGLLYPAVAGAAYAGSWRIPQEKVLWDHFSRRSGSHGPAACPAAKAPKHAPEPIPAAPPGRGPAPRYCSPQINCTAHPDTDVAFFQYTPAGAHAQRYDAC
eukprot:COSAG05_NODE_1359_length_5097_cov_2.531813_2_plen_640_part_00